MEKAALVRRSERVQRSALPAQTEHVATSAVVLPEQFYHPPACTRGCGEAALMRAVLEEAVACFQKQFVKNGRRTQSLAREAEEWIYSDEVSWLFSFVNICAALGLDPAYIRRNLKGFGAEAASFLP